MSMIEGRPGIHAGLVGLLSMLTVAVQVGAGQRCVSGVVLHLVVVLVLFRSLTVLTGCLRPSAFVAALVAVHPLHVGAALSGEQRPAAIGACLLALMLWALADGRRRPSRQAIWLVLGSGVILGLVCPVQLVVVPALSAGVFLWLPRHPDRAGEGDRCFSVVSVSASVLALLVGLAATAQAFWSAAWWRELAARLPRALAWSGWLVTRVVRPGLVTRPAVGATGAEASLAGVVVIGVLVTALGILLFRFRHCWPSLVGGWVWGVLAVAVISLAGCGSKTVSPVIHLAMPGLYWMAAFALGRFSSTRPWSIRPTLVALAAALLVAGLAALSVLRLG